MTAASSRRRRGPRLFFLNNFDSISYMKFFFPIFVLSYHWAFADTCEEWFSKLEIEKDKSCLIQCVSAPIGFDTLTCHEVCDSMCKQKSERCIADKAWEQSIKFGRPNNWPHERETAILWTTEERKKILSVLSRLPESYSPKDLRGIYKLNEPKFFFSLGTPSTYLDRTIVFYERAFDRTNDLTQLFIHEFGHFLFETELKSDFKDYKKVMGWRGHARPGVFVRTDAKEDPEEDFAINFETYILDPKKLKSHLPKAHRWMSNRLKSQFNLKECKK